MKKYLTLICSLALLLAIPESYAQQTGKVTSKGKSDQVDTRIDNMQYWMKKAEKGLVPYNQKIPLLPSIYTGSQIQAKGVKTTNSPDVAVTNLTNVTESENSVFVDPNNAEYLLNSNNSTSWSGGTVGTLYGADYLESLNAGITWGGSVNGAGGANSGDPTTAISLSGRQYVNYIDDPGGQGIAYSDNSGSTWSTATIAPNPGDLADKNHMWIDNKASSPYVGNLYTAWTDFGGTDDTQIKISRSTNNGLTWSTGLNLSSAINAGSHNQGVNVQTGPNGEVYVAWAVYDSWPSDESAIGFAKSTNGGVSYLPASRVISNIKGIRNTTAGKNHRTNSFPSMAVDISGGAYNGNIYIVWTNVGTPGTNSGTNKSVYLIRSSDNGTTWSAPIRINQGAFLEGKAAYFPWISCDPETGVLSVVFYDDRDVSSAQNEVFAAYSTDAGNTWTDFKVSDVAFTPSPIPGLASSYMGDYLGITSKGGKVYPCWTDNRDGIYMTYVSPFELGLNAGFTANATTLCTGTAVTFTSTSTGPPTSWTWSFPGGVPSSYIGPTPPPVTYYTAGTYDVSLTVSDGTNTDTETKTGYITVKDVIAGFTGNPTTVVIGNSVSFTDNSSCSPSAWNWSFPGGTPSSWSGQTPPAITYNTLGTYDVILTVTKPGASDTKTRSAYVTVTPPIFNMTNGTITTCTGDFYDSGGLAGSYQNNENYTETFMPATPGNMMQMTFTSFATESGYDYLRIYDGTTTAAPLIGTYNGTTGPGTVTATNVTGALTFNFTSDVSVTPAGWAATISCQNPNINANFSASSTTACVSTGVTFTDLSIGAPTTWTWSFPGGTPSSYVGQNPPPVSYLIAGTYNVSLTVSDGTNTDTETKNSYITIDPLVAAFTSTATTICSGSTVTFTESSLCNPTSWTWSFPGGSPSSYVGQTPPPITYSTAGTYDVTLAISNGTSSDSEIKTGYIVVNFISADFTAVPTTVVVENTVTFTDNSTCSPTSWSWSFPGGTPSTYSGQTPPPITYNTIGTYDVVLTVAKPGGNDTKTKSAYITVTPPIFNMSNGSVYTCSGDFYDTGGSAGAYQNSENITETFYPSTAGSMIQFVFNSFVTESGYDYLRIYDGTSTSATLIGTYNGSAGPGTVMATNASGALTFNFTSDGSVTYAGWSAAISCINVNVPPVAQFIASSTAPAPNSTVTFTDQSTNFPTSWAWSFIPNTVVYVGGTSATSQNPQVQFTTLGLYTVSLTATNGYGSDAEVKTNYINVIPTTYCIPTYTSGTGYGDYISLVQLGSINNATGASASPYYTFYNTLSTDLTPGSAYTITLSPGTYSSGNYIAAWIDFNQNAVFDADEKIGTVLIGPMPATGTLNFTVPVTANSGVTRMRIREVWNNSDFDACLSYSYGETEDYNVNIVSSDKPLNLVLYLEGLFNGTAMNKAQNAHGDQFPGTVADQVIVELHNSTSPYALAGGPYTVNVNMDGSASVTIPAALNSSYYVVVQHRNSIETWSGTPLSFSGTSVNHNFTTAATQAYGSNLKLVSGKYVIFSGDVNQDGIVDSGDMIPVDNASGYFMTGYIPEDTNGDGLIDSGDMIQLDNNSSLFIVKITP
jgi:PKD repeat protein